VGFWIEWSTKLCCYDPRVAGSKSPRAAPDSSGAASVSSPSKLPGRRMPP